MLTYPFSQTINANGKLLDLSKPKIMGIVNITPDSFYDGGRYLLQERAIAHAEQLWAEGADVLDLGAYSSRPGAEGISAQEELDRLLPVLSEIRRRIPESILSVDTFRASVAEAAVAAGADIINDISGGYLDAAMHATVGKLQVPYILMHMRGTPETMQNLTNYKDLLYEMQVYFRDNIAKLRKEGVRDIILDLGFGFAKTLQQNYTLLKHLEDFKWFGLPILGAVSRKSMIYRALNTSAEEALNGSTVLHTLLLLKGVQLLRVHDIQAVREAVQLLDLYQTS